MEGLTSELCLSPVLGSFEAAQCIPTRRGGRSWRWTGISRRPSPRFSRTDSGIRRGPPNPGQDTDAALADWGLGADEASG